MIQTAIIEKFSLWVWGVVSMFIKASTNLGVLLLSCFLQPLLSCSAWSHFFGKAFSWLPAAKHGKGVLLAALHADASCFVAKGCPLGAFGPWYLKNRPGVWQGNVRFQIPPRTGALLFVEPAMLRGGLGKASPYSGIFGQQHSHHREAYPRWYASRLFRALAGTPARSKGAAPSSAVFVLAQGSWPQAGCLLPGRPTRRRGEWGRNWPMFSCFTAPLCTLFRRSGCVFLHCAHCLFSLRLPGQSRGNAAKGIGSMV